MIYVSDTTDHQNLNKRKQFENSMPLLTGNTHKTQPENLDINSVLLHVGNLTILYLAL